MMLQRTLLLYGVALAVGCGGATEREGPDVGSGGTTSVDTSTASVSDTSTASVSTTGGPPICSLSLCGGTPCPDGQLVTPPAQCCPVCSCDQVECEPLDCPSGKTMLAPGACCEECAGSGCENVLCAGPTECGSGQSWQRPAGACCGSCLPDEPGNVACLEIACPSDKNCSAGYIRGDIVGGCCYDCLPDPLFCEDASDCVLADRPRDCCGCPEVISTRALDDDACWYAVNDPRPIPDECYPDAICDALCGACPNPGQVMCLQNRCVELPLTDD